MPWPRADFGLFALGRRLFLVGGQKRGGFVSDVDVLDTRSGQWESAAPLGEPRRGIAFARAGDVVYAFGGMDERFRFSDSVERYDMAARAVTPLRPAPRPMAWAAAAAAGEAVYVLGGFDAGAGGGQRQAWRYLPAADRWEKLPPLLEGAGGCALSWEGKIYLAGGTGRPAAERTEAGAALHMYDPAAGRWDALAPMPAPRGAARGVAAYGRLLLVGGKAGDKSGLRAVDEYEILAGRWQVLDGLRHGRGAAGVALAAGKVWVMGGECSREGLFDAVEVAAWPESTS